LVYVSIDVFKVFSLNIEENGIEKPHSYLGQNIFYFFDSVLSMKTKNNSKNTRGVNISDGCSYGVWNLKLEKV
jgi:hypothetical protein